MDKKISVIIPVHNAGKYIEETIYSVVNQTYQNYELLLVNDGSTDDSVSVINRIIEKENNGKIILLHNSNSGSAARARNAGIDFASGELISFLDADDIWDSKKLEKTKAFMEEKNSAFVFTGYEFADNSGKGLGKIVRVPDSINYKQALSRTVIFTSTVMFDMSKLSKEEIKMPEIKSEDTATWWRILRNGIIANGLDESLVMYRRGENTLSSNKIEAIKRIWNLYRKSEKLSLVKSAVCFVGWAFGAVARRI